MTAASPSAITKKATPVFSLCRVSCEPAGTRRCLKSLASPRSWRWLRPLNRGTRFRSSAMLATRRPYLKGRRDGPVQRDAAPRGVGRLGDRECDPAGARVRRVRLDEERGVLVDLATGTPAKRSVMALCMCNGYHYAR